MCRGNDLLKYLLMIDITRANHSSASFNESSLINQLSEGRGRKLKAEYAYNGLQQYNNNTLDKLKHSSKEGATSPIAIIDFYCVHQNIYYTATPLKRGRQGPREKMRSNGPRYINVTVVQFHIRKQMPHPPSFGMRHSAPDKN